MKRFAILAIPALVYSMTACPSPGASPAGPTPPDDDDLPENTVLTTADVPVCPTVTVEDWQYVETHTMGVDGWDPVGDQIGFRAARKVLLGLITASRRNWRPADGYKNTVCGTLHHFNVYDPFFSGAETDWCNYLVPDPEFEYVIRDLESQGDLDQWVSCDAERDCFEMEITPDQSFYHNEWFPKPAQGFFETSSQSGASPLEGEKICTYGPWVTEKLHGKRPEIHPSELIWWRDASGRAFLMMLQDDSKRFDRTRDYHGSDGAVPAFQFHPWSEAPRTAQFRLSFEVETAGEPLVLDIYRLAGFNVVTGSDPDASEDADDGAQHALEYNGLIVLRVNEMQADDADLGVTFAEVCRDAGDSRLRGYVAVTAKVGEDDRGKEGYLVLRVDEQGGAVPVSRIVSRPAGVEQQVTQPRVSTQVNLVLGSLRRVEMVGRQRLVADIRVDLVGTEEATEADVTLTSAQVMDAGQLQTLSVESIAPAGEGQQGSGLVRNLPIPMAATGQLILQTQSGESLGLNIPPLTLALLVSEESVERSTPDADAWTALSAAAGGDEVESTPPGAVLGSAVWEVELAPLYATARFGRPSLEDESPIAEALNDELHTADTDRVVELFGSARPIESQWTYVATDVVSGDTLPVAVNEPAGPGAVQVNEVAVGTAGSGIQVTFPEQPGGRVIRLVASAAASDVFGLEGSTSHTVWSHFWAISDEEADAEVLMPVIADLASVSGEQLLRASTLQDPSARRRAAPDQQARMARILRATLIDAIEDNRITVDELAVLIDFARRAGE